jgi:YD repeat-containing protein
MNKSIKILMGLWLLYAGLPLLAQTTTPEASVAGLMAFTENPVDICSGIPDISIPLVKLPTRSPDINLDINMAYHPKSGGQTPGQGWNVFAGGLITRRVVGLPDESYGSGYYNGDDIFEFDFMGKSGMFYVTKNATSGVLEATNLDSKGENLKITLAYTTSTLSPGPYFTITSFTIYSVQGYQYVFTSVDSEKKDFGAPKGWLNYNETWHLTSIYDNNNKKLLSFKYADVTQTFIAAGTTSYNYFHRTDSITSNGFGKIVFNYSSDAVSSYSLNMKLTGLSMQDQFNNVVKKCNISSTQLDIMNPLATIKETYLFYYKDAMGRDANGNDTYHYNSSLPVCATTAVNYDNTDPQLVTLGTLQKMMLPTGGAVIYDFESNTYNNYQNLDDESNMYVIVPGDEQYFTRNYDQYFIPENNIVTEWGQHEFTSTSQTYGIGIFTGAPLTFYYQIAGDGYIPPGFGGGTVYPTFTLTIPANEGGGSFALSTSSVNVDHCLGLPYTLDENSPEWSIAIHGIGGVLPHGNVILQTLARNPNPTRGFYGYGVRLRASAQFTDGSVDQHYYNDVTGYNGLGFSPVKDRTYNYDFFGQPKVSSGTVSGMSVGIDYRASVIYKNVTVTDKPSNGRTQYTFTTPFDYEQSNAGFTYYDYRAGLIKQIDIYNISNNLVKSEEYYYEFDDDSFSINVPLPKKIGWAPVTQKYTKYFYGSTPVWTTETFDYFARQVLHRTLTNSVGEVLKTTYNYDPSNSSYSQNRLAPSQTINFRGTTQLASNIVAYSNTFSGNASYLPSTLSSGKGSETPTVVQRYNAYDEYGHIKESQQENGIKTAYIYGYNKSLLVAQIDNMAYASIPIALITNIQTASNSNNTAGLLTALTALRNDSALAGAMVTSYTYIPLVGISTNTDPKGDMLTYSYDTFGRLISIKDKNGNLLSENAYHLKTQTP